jgi:uncharacterized protein (TIGR03083 family)
LSNSAKVAPSAYPVTRHSVPDVLEATRTALSRVTGLLTNLPSKAWAAPACGDWTVDQTAAHLAVGPIAYLEIIDQIGAGTRDELFDVNDPEFSEAQLIMFGNAVPQDRIDALQGSFAQFICGVQQVPDALWDQVTWTPEGLMPAAAALGIGLNELTVHEYDIRRAAGLPLQVPSGTDTALTPFAVYALAGLIQQGGWPPLELAIEGSTSVLLRWVDGAVELTKPEPHDPEESAMLACGPSVLSLLTWKRISLANAAKAGLATLAGPQVDVDAVFAACRSF